jgi:hypothetical protein
MGVDDSLSANGPTVGTAARLAANPLGYRHIDDPIGFARKGPERS